MSHFYPFVINPSNDILKKYPSLPKLTEQLSQDYAQHCVTETSLKTIGLLLWQSLQIDEQFNQLYQKYQSLASIIQFQNQQIHLLPWECLYHPTLGFFSRQTNFTLSRRFLKQTLTKNFSLLTPIRILLFSLPHEELQLEFEQYEIYQVLRQFITQGRVQLFICDNGDFAHFQALLQQQTWHLVLFSGHHLLTTETKESFFIFENEQGQKEAIATNEIATLFQSVICVVLLACQTAQFAQQLAQRGVPYVIGIQAEILDRAAVIFIKNFLMSLLQQGRIDVAVQYGRKKLTNLLINNEKWHDSNNYQGQCNYQGQWILPILLSNHLTNDFLLRFMASESIPTFLQCNISAFSVLIGRRKGVQNLLKIVKSGHYPQLLITGVRGIGKTAFAEHVVNRLYLEDYNVFACQASTLIELTDALSKWLKITTFEACEIKIALTRIKSQKWIIWLDHINSNQYVAMSCFFEQLSNFANFSILMTSYERFSIPTNCYQYNLTKLDFEDFVRYVHYLGLPYEAIQLRLLYQFSAGNFRAIQLLQTMPIQKVSKEFMQQLISIKRYLQAYLRQNG